MKKSVNEIAKELNENVNEIVTKLKENAVTVINEIATKEKIPDLILYTTGIGIMFIGICYVFAISPIPVYLFVIPIYLLYKRYHNIESKDIKVLDDIGISVNSRNL